MSIAASLAFAVLAATLEAGPLGLQPITVHVTAASDIKRTIIDDALDEAEAIWRAAGVRLIWRRSLPLSPAALHVVIGGGRSRSDEELQPLGWILLNGDATLSPRIYVSHGNAVQMLLNSRTFLPLDRIPVFERDLYVSRAMGRALAHEIGHYLLDSKAHTPSGLMSAAHSSTEFFGPTRVYFKIDRVQQQLVAARFTSIYIASRP